MASKKGGKRERKSVDEDIIQDERYRMLFETSQDAIMLLDRERFFDCNPATLKMFGLTKEIFIKLHPSEISPPRQPNGSKSREEADRLISEAFEKGTNKFDWVHKRSNGENFAVTVWLTAFPLEGKDVLQATVREIPLTDESKRDLEAHRLKLQMLLDEQSSGLQKESMERKKAEGEVRRLIKAVETSFNAIALFDMDMKFIYANQAFCKLAAINESDIHKRTARDFVPDESLKIIMEKIESNIDGQSIGRFEVKTKNSLGQELWVEIAGSVLFGEDGEPEGLLAIINDTTERRNIQRTLIDRSKILEAMSEGVITFGKGGLVKDVNPAYERMTGLTREEVVGKPGPEIAANIVKPESLKAVLNAFRVALSGEKVAPIEVDIIRKDGGHSSILFTITVTGYSDPDATSIIAVLQDIGSMKIVQRALRESEEKFKMLVERSNDGIVILQDEKIIYMNPALVKLSGFAIEELIGRRFIDNVAPENRDEIIARYRARMNGENVPPIYEMLFLTKDGTKIPLEINATVIEYLGRPADFVYLRDLTERKRVEQEIHTIKEQFEYVLGATNTGFDIIDEDLNVKYVDPEWANVLGDYSGRKCYEYFMGGKKPCKDCAIPRALETGKRTISEEYLEKENRYIEVHTIPLKTNGEKRLVAEFNIDITERKKMLKDLEASESKYRNLVETTHTGYVVLDDGGKVVDANDEYVRMTGHSSLDEILGRMVTDWTAPHDLKRNATAVKECFKNGLIRNLEIDYIWENGSILPIEVNATTLDMPKGKQIITLCNDITLRRQSENALKESEEKFRNLAENSPNMIFINKKGKVVYANKRSEELMGYTREEFYSEGFNLFQIIHEDHHDLIRNNLKRHFSGEDIPPYEYKLVTKNGDILDAIINTKSVDYEGEIAIMGIVTDISGLKKAELALRNTTEQLRSLNENLADGMVYQINGGKDGSIQNFTYLSTAVERMRGLKLKDVMKNPQLLYDQVLEEDREQMLRVRAETFAERKKMDMDLRIRLPSGEVRWRRFVAVPNEDEQGNVIWNGIELDITARKEAEEKLVESELKYRTLTEKANDAIFLADAETGILLDVNQKACELTGRTREELIGMHQSKLHPKKEIENYKEIFKRHVMNGTAIDEFIVVQHKDGHTISVSISASVFELQGRMVNQGIFHDLTERVNAEKALREADEKVRMIFQSMEDLVFGFDKDGKFISVQTPSDGILYAPQEAFIGKKYSEVMPPHVTKLIKKAFKANQDRQTIDFEYDLEIGDEKMWFSAKMSPIFADDEYNGSVAVVRDITERKRTEDALATSREQLNALFNASTSGIGVEKDGDLFFVNPSFLTMFGYSKPEELLGKPLSNMVAPEHRKMMKNYSKLRLSGQAPPVYEFIGQKKDGTNFHAEASVSVYQINKENYFVGFVQDITERKAIEKTLMVSEQVYRSLYESTMALGEMKDIEQIMEVIAEQAKNMLGGVCSTIYIWDEKKRLLVPAYSNASQERDKFMTFEMPLGTGLTGHVAQTEKGAYANYNDARPRAIKGSVPGTSTKDDHLQSIIAEPFFDDGKLLGVINVIGMEQVFNDDDLGKLRILAKQTAIAYSHIRSLDGLMKSEARFRRMAENIHDGLTIIENGKASYINDRAVEIYGYPREELMKMTHLDLVIPEDKEQMMGIIEKAGKNNQRLGELEFWVQRKDGSRRYVRTRISTSQEEGSTSEFIITTDITARKQAEEENKRKVMKFLLDDGRVYLIKEFRPSISIEAFNDLLNLEYAGMVLSRTPKKDLAKSIKGPFEHIWLGEKTGKELFDDVLTAISEAGGKSAVFIDRLDYLIFKYGFKETLEFLFKLRDQVYLKEQVVIITIDPSTMKEEELNIIQKEVSEVEQRQVPRPAEDIFEIAQLIYDKNSMGIKPSYSEIGEELKISKPTFRKRVRRLINAGYAVELTKGNRKVLELTQKGRSLFFK